MGSDHAIIIALLVVLVAVVAFQGGGWMSGGAGVVGGGPGGTVGGGGAGPQGFTNPWAGMARQYAAVNGNPDGPKILRSGRALVPQLARRKAAATPEQLAKAERSSWFRAKARSQRASGFDAERMYDTADQISNEHETSPQGDWNSAVVDQIADARMRENQKKWNSEMEPFSTTWIKADDMDEAAVFGLGGPGNAQGLYAFSRSGPIVRNPSSLTDLGPEEFSQMRSRFNFKG